MKNLILASTNSADVSQQTFTPLAEWVWQVANAILIVFGVIAGIFLIFVLGYYFILLAKHKDPEERKEILGKFLWWVVGAVGIIVVCSISNILFPLIEGHMMFAPISNSASSSSSSNS